MATKHVVTGDQYRIIHRRMREILRQLDQDGGSPLDPDEVACALQQLIERRFGEQPEAYPGIIDYGMSFADMIEAGKYDWTNPDITAKNFPVSGEDKVGVEFELVHFDRPMSTDEALKELDKQGLLPAKIEELLAFGAAYPEVQREFPIVCLGSVWADRGGYRDVPCLDEDDSMRRLDLYWDDNDWNDACRFLAVRK